MTNARAPVPVPAAYWRLPVLTLTELLQELDTLRSAVRSGTPTAVPELTLHLRSGQTLRGHFITWRAPSSHADGVILLGQPSGDHMDTAYIPLLQVEAVTVHYRIETMHLLSGGKLQAAPTRIPTNLELKRQADATQSAVRARAGRADWTLDVRWEALLRTDEARATFSNVLDDLDAVLQSLFESELGTEELANLDGIAIEPSATAGLKRRGDWLVLSLQPDGPDLRYITRVELQREIERQL